MFEKLADAKEPERLSQMHINKADGIQSCTYYTWLRLGTDYLFQLRFSVTYSESDLIRASVHFLEKPSAETPSKIHVALRSRAMVLISSCMAFRGDNTRNILWSDLFLRDIPLVDIGLDYMAPVSTPNDITTNYIYWCIQLKFRRSWSFQTKERKIRREEQMSKERFDTE